MEVFSKIWWIASFATGVVGAIVTFLLVPQLENIKFKIMGRLLKKDFLTGPWIEYHFIYKSSEPVLKQESWDVRKVSKSKYKVTAKLKCGSLKYKGEMITEREQVFSTMTSIVEGHIETIAIRFPKPVPGTQAPIFGLWLAIDHSGNACTGALLLSRKPIPKKELSKLFESHIELDSKNFITTIKTPK